MRTQDSRNPPTSHRSTLVAMSTTIPGPDLTPAQMHLASPVAPVTGTVVSNERCTASSKAAGFVRHIAFDIAGTPLARSFVAGQSFGVLPPGLDANNKPHKLRLYSLASPSFGEDGNGSVVATTVKRLIDEHWETNKLYTGVASNYLCDLRPGDKVQLTGPSGKRFVLPLRPDEHDYVFFATGTGIAPFRGMLMDLSRRAPHTRCALIMGSPYATDLLYHKQMQELTSIMPNFRYIPALSREKQLDGKPAMYAHDQITHSREIIEPLLANPRGLVYICGIAGMELGVLQRLATTLHPADREQYLEVDAATLADVKNWQRTMLHKQVKPTRRVFMEVY
jgi:ferredoxin--NADP+ reductase